MISHRVDARVANKRLLESARAGAFDSLLNNRARLHENVDVVLRHATAAAQDRGSNQVSLFAAREAPTCPNCACGTAGMATLGAAGP